MTIRALHSKATIKGHPIHPMLVGFPIALYTSGVVSLVVYAIARDVFWYRAAMTLLFAGVAMAVLSAIFGTIDLFLGVPRKEKATRSTGVIHLGLNVASLVLFTGAALSLLGESRGDVTPGVAPDDLSFGLPLTIGVIGLLLTGAAGAYGWKLVQTHHVGIADEGESAFEDARAPTFRS
ncbi:MAG: Rieske (2Fe-2S) oxidoreductase [Myxococcales bacterium]|nr:Rieske (2Fe-2S) oxidoreductase [Myxococcales bacterium]